MANTGIIPIPITHNYNEINIGKYKVVKHYQITDLFNNSSCLTEILNVSLNREFAKSNPAYWLKIRIGKKWHILTGLFPTINKNVFYGDKGTNNKKEDLIVIEFSDNQQTLIVYYFKNYYTNNINKVLQFLNL